MEVAQVGVRTRTRTRTQARDEAMAEAATSRLTKRRKLNGNEFKNISSCIQLRNRTSDSTGSKTVSDIQCSNPGLELFDRDRVSTSCCFIHGSSCEGIEFVDLKDESVDVEVEVETSTYYGFAERRETTPSSELEAEEESDDLDSTTKPSSEANSRRRLTVEKMPTESEIEDFFAEAEKKLVKHFSEKYNFDFTKEKPMEGRYEWVQLRP